MAYFFLELYEKDGLQPITIKGYRAAIARVYRLTDMQWDPGADIFLSEIIWNFTLDHPTTTRLFPKWSLELVLSCLSSDSFEPLPQATLQRVLQKSLFLLTLATAGRVSEVQALSAAPDCLAFNQDGSATLLPNATFIAKNRLPEVAPKPFMLLPCSDELVCPVRALRCYVNATHTMRDATLPLWINPRTKKRASKSFISSWIRTTIKEAYDWSAAGQQRPPADWHDVSSTAAVQAAVAAPLTLVRAESRMSPP